MNTPEQVREYLRGHGPITPLVPEDGTGDGYVCKHGWTTPDVCVACLREELESLRERNVRLTNKTVELHNENCRLHVENDALCESAKELESLRQENGQMRDALSRCVKDFDILLERGDFADEDVPRVTATCNAGRMALSPQC